PVCIDSIPSLPLPASRYAAMLEEGSGYIVDCSPTGGAVLAIGPEGDWTSKEKERLLSEGFRAVSLGSRIMTSPTAAAVGLGCLSMKLEKFNEAKS
ncbi:MAG: Ribosomal RNA small subunit methyltransferase E, partial [Synergistales bacterium 54_9]